jgi:hypothetical protein
MSRRLWVDTDPIKVGARVVARAEAFTRCATTGRRDDAM